jgi:hypothetical protein
MWQRERIFGHRFQSKWRLRAGVPGFRSSGILAAYFIPAKIVFPRGVLEIL